MTASEQASLNQMKITQAVMKEHQRNMQEDIDELKKSAREINDKLDRLTSTLDSLSGGKQALMWITGIFIALSGLLISYLNIKGKK